MCLNQLIRKFTWMFKSTKNTTAISHGADN